MATSALAMSTAPKVGWSTETVPRSKARRSMNVRFQRIGGTTSYTTASPHQMNLCPLSIILLKKSWSSPVRNSGLNAWVSDPTTLRLTSTLLVRPFVQSMINPVGYVGRS